MQKNDFFFYKIRMKIIMLSDNKLEAEFES